MDNPGLLMQLGDHLFSAQMAVYRSKYTSLLFPSDATYTPPTLPAHVSVTLEPVSGAPSEEQVTKIQEAIRSYQKLSEVPSIFEPRVSAELSQHLFDIQLARYMHRAAQRQPSTRPHEVTRHPNLVRAAETTIDRTEKAIAHTNNAGTGGAVAGSHQLQDTSIRDILERSNQAAERANQLSERSNQLIERSNQIVEKNNQLIERSNLPAEQLTQPTDSSNTSHLDERPNELLGRLNQHLEHSNRLAEAFKTPIEQIGDALRTINKVLVRIQHAIVRSHKGNTPFTIRSLVNEKGDVPMDSWMPLPEANSSQLHFGVNGRIVTHTLRDHHVVDFLQFYGIEGDFFKDPEKTELLEEKRADARQRLALYFTSALGL
ncbi:hypothetical protein RSAG8_11043, partial [Rhizoctonia solani AG-8 WAC10335]